MSEPLMTTKEAAAYLKVHKLTVLRMINRGELKATKVGRHWRIQRSEVERISKPQEIRSDHE